MMVILRILTVCHIYSRIPFLLLLLLLRTDEISGTPLSPNRLHCSNKNSFVLWPSIGCSGLQEVQ